MPSQARLPANWPLVAMWVLSVSIIIIITFYRAAWNADVVLQ